jgi:hypothetical protein
MHTHARTGATHIDTAQSMANLGLLCQDLQRYDESEQFMRQSLAITERILGYLCTNIWHAILSLSLSVTYNLCTAIDMPMSAVVYAILPASFSRVANMKKYEQKDRVIVAVVDVLSA